MYRVNVQHVKSTAQLQHFHYVRLQWPHCCIHTVCSQGNGPVSAFVAGLNNTVFLPQARRGTAWHVVARRLSWLKPDSPAAQGMAVHLSDYHSEASEPEIRTAEQLFILMLEAAQCAEK